MMISLPHFDDGLMSSSQRQYSRWLGCGLCRARFLPAGRSDAPMMTLPWPSDDQFVAATTAHVWLRALQQLRGHRMDKHWITFCARANYCVFAAAVTTIPRYGGE